MKDIETKDVKDMPPTRAYVEFCKRGKLAYQICTDDGAVVFYPRVICPKTASPNLEWRVSSGLGTVYTMTTIHRRDRAPYNVSMIELNEGFRMMSRVEDADPGEVRIGMRVRMHMHPGDDEQHPYPIFVPAEGG